MCAGESALTPQEYVQGRRELIAHAARSGARLLIVGGPADGAHDADAVRVFHPAADASSGRPPEILSHTVRREVHEARRSGQRVRVLAGMDHLAHARQSLDELITNEMDLGELATHGGTSVVCACSRLCGAQGLFQDVTAVHSRVVGLQSRAAVFRLTRADAESWKLEGSVGLESLRAFSAAVRGALARTPRARLHCAKAGPDRRGGVACPGGNRDAVARRLAGVGRGERDRVRGLAHVRVRRVRRGDRGARIAEAQPDVAVPGFLHMIYPYAGEQQYLSGTVAYIEHARATGGNVIVAAPPARREALGAQLGAEAGVTFVDTDALGRNPGRLIPVWQDWIGHLARTGAVHGINESVFSGHSPAHYGELRYQEWLLNLAFAQAPALALMCPVDTGGQEEAAVKALTRCHPLLWNGTACVPGSWYGEDEYAFEPLPEPEQPAEQMTYDLGSLHEARPGEDVRLGDAQRPVALPGPGVHPRDERSRRQQRPARRRPRHAAVVEAAHRAGVRDDGRRRDHGSDGRPDQATGGSAGRPRPVVRQPTLRPGTDPLRPRAGHPIRLWMDLPPDEPSGSAPRDA